MKKRHNITSKKTNNNSCKIQNKLRFRKYGDLDIYPVQNKSVLGGDKFSSISVRRFPFLIAHLLALDNKFKIMFIHYV